MCIEALSRRKFLKLIGSGAIAATIDAYSRPFEKTIAYADFGASSSIGRIITVFQAGGPTKSILPVYHPEFYEKYPTLHFKPEDSHPLNNSGMPIGLHPALSYFKQLYDAGELTVVNEIGYPNPNRSHDGSTRICDYGVRSMSLRKDGWGARLVADKGPFGGFAFSDSEWSKGAMNVRSGSNFGQTFRESRFSYNQIQEQFVNLRNALLNGEEKKFAKGNTNAQYVLESLHRGVENADHILATLDQDLPDIDVEFPNNSFGRQCKESVSLAMSALGVNAFRLQQGGYDTHANEGDRVNNLLTTLNGGLEALIKSLKALNLWSTTAIVIFGEFGRTFENNSEGSDHGHGSQMFVLSGAGLRTGVIGEPLFREARRSYVEGYNVDFRQVILEASAKLGFQTGSLFPDLRESPIGLFL